MKKLAILLAGLAAAGCSHAHPDTLGQLKSLTRDTACSGNQQCRTVAVGAKACGGPESYLAYSTAKADPAKVEALAERYRKERQAENDKRGVASDCSMVSDPGAVCRANSCQPVGLPDR